MQKIIVRVPASTSNLGPGFDCLGVALRLYNEIGVARGERESRRLKIVDETARLFFKKNGFRPFEFAASIKDNIPRGRGLGSSATARVGLLHGLNELAGRPLDRLSIFQLAAELEGHPDNAAPASFGGFTVVRWKTFQRFEVSPRLSFVLLVPDFEIATPQARKVLPAKVSRAAAIENVANAAAITAAFASREYGQLRGAFVDHLHQPFRRKLIPILPRVVAAAEKAGALGAFLSGSGSTICALTLRDPDQVAAAMQRSGKTQARTIITKADNTGVQIKHQTSNIKHS